MIDKKEILKLVSNLTHPGAARPRRAMYPEREWFFAVIFGVFVFGVSAYYAGSVFFREYKNIDTAVEVDSSETVYKKEVVDEVIHRFEVRNAQFEALRDAGGFAPAQPEVSEPAAESAPTSGASLKSE